MIYSIKKKICIVGSGFCGYTAYKKFSEKNLDIIIIEGGNLKSPKSEKDQPFYKTKKNRFVNNIKINNKVFNISNNVDISFRDRRFTLGGSSEGWTGVIKPFEDTTYANCFKNKKYQKWGDLSFKKYNLESLDILKSPLQNFDPFQVAENLNLKLPILPKGLFYTVFAWAEEPVRLKRFWHSKSTSNHKSLSKDKNVLYSYKLIDANLENGKIKSLIFISNKNEKLVIEADTFIIAMGGVENAKFANILNKKINQSNSDIGNFQEHPHLYWIGKFNLGSQELPEVFKDRIPYTSKINGNKGFIKFNIVAWDGEGSPKVSFDINKYPNKLKGIFKYSIKLMQFQDWHIHMRCEQTPNKNSKLEFLNSQNSLNWKILSSDLKYYLKYLKRYSTFLESENFIKNFKPDYNTFGESFLPKEVFGAGHHMGSFPYNQKESNIDRNLRHSVFKNMFFIGTSSFPTSGFENPTHTAIASSLSTIDYILKQNL